MVDLPPELQRGQQSLEGQKPTISDNGTLLVASLSFYNHQQLKEKGETRVDWVWDGYLARENVTLFSGLPKMGKSTLGLAIAGAVGGTADVFLGHKLAHGEVLYVSEENRSTLIHKMPEKRVRIAPRQFPQPTWAKLTDGLRQAVAELDILLVVIDTFTFWSAFSDGESENKAATMNKALTSLAAIANEGAAVGLVHHYRKGGGEDGEAIRGSTAIVGAVDISVELLPIRGGSPGQRQLLALSRYDVTPGTLIAKYDQRNQSWSVEGEQQERSSGPEIAVRTYLERVGKGCGRKELEDELGMSWFDIKRALDNLVSEGLVETMGLGKRGDPKLWYWHIETPGK
jgi:AAA domain